MQKVVPLLSKDLFKKTWLRMIFLAWRLEMEAKLRRAYEAEVEVLKTKLGKQSTSIWTMNKSDLMEVARRELGMSLAEADSKNMSYLKEKIRANRTALKAQANPMMQIPKGLERMLKPVLIQEMIQRGIPMPEAPTRNQMIVLIRDHVQFLLDEDEKATSQDWIMAQSADSAAAETVPPRNPGEKEKAR
jgi:hypothetical protein